MTLNFSPPTPALFILALAGCVPSVLIGDNPQDSLDPESSSGATSDATNDATSDATAEPTSSSPSTGEPEPGFCGDGVVDPGEVCDDGNDEPNDGCDVACNVSGEVEWVVEGVGEVTDIEVAPDGTILVSRRENTALLTAFAPDGSELWSRQAPWMGELAVDAQGRIFLLSGQTGVHAFAPDGADLWSVKPMSGPAAIPGIDVDDEKVYIATYEDGTDQVIVRGLDVATGAVVWETIPPADEPILAEDVTVLGDRLHVVGRKRMEDQALRAASAVFTTDGELLSFELVDTVVQIWTSSTVSEDGDLVVAGHGFDAPGFVARRLSPALDEVWTSEPAGTAVSKSMRVAAGPGGRVAVVGSDPADQGSAVRFYDSDGALRWSSAILEEGAAIELARGAAFGPDFLAVAGIVLSGEDNGQGRWWLRRFAID